MQAAIDRVGDQILVDVLVKPIDNRRTMHHSNVKSVRSVVRERFTKEDIYKLCNQESI